MKGEIIMAKFIKKSLVLLGFLAAIGALVMLFIKKQERENDFFDDEDDDFDDVTMPQKSMKDTCRSYINLV